MFKTLTADMDVKGKLLMGRYDLGKRLGQGSFAKVYQADDILNNQKVAIKVIEKEKVSESGTTKQITREISIMKLVKHPNIVKYYEVMANKSKIYIVMEFANGGQLFNRVRKGRLREHIARKYFQQLISAVAHCHRRDVYHRDLKLENLLLDENENIKVLDFGLSALSETRHEDGLLYTACGTPDYVPPEIILRRGYDGAKADIWSCGVILYAMLAGELPFHDSNLILLYRKICRADYEFPMSLSADACELLSKMLDPNPNTRISIVEIMQNSWFKMGLNWGVKTPEEGNNVVPQAAEGEFKPTVWNAFDIIAHSIRFNLSSLFAKNDEKGEVCFTSNSPVSTIISKLEDTARTLNLTVMKKGGGLLKLEGLQDCGLEGMNLDAEIFELAPSVYLVEIKNSDGGTSEFKKIVNVLRTALDEIVWVWQGE